jgi:hypothetical protein
MCVCTHALPTTDMNSLTLYLSSINSEKASLNNIWKKENRNSISTFPETCLYGANKNKNMNSLALVYERIYRRSDCHLSSKLVQTFTDRGCHMVSAVDLHSRLSRPEPLLFLSSSSSFVLTRLVDPIADPLLLRKHGSAGNRTQELWPLNHRGEIDR